tara:strand:- start:923 stop:1084 length:162 start_codon:yes stop_codon:yes gene_type:complete
MIKKIWANTLFFIAAFITIPVAIGMTVFLWVLGSVAIVLSSILTTIETLRNNK